jgi:hypothetical protein
MEDFEERRRDLVDPNVDNCSTASFQVRVEESGRKILVMSSCANWGDVARVSNGNGSSCGEMRHNQAVLSEDEERTSPVVLIDRDIATISGKCFLLCVECTRFEPVVKSGWPGTVPKITAHRRKVLESLGLASNT